MRARPKLTALISILLFFCFSGFAFASESPKNAGDLAQEYIKAASNADFGKMSQYACQKNSINASPKFLKNYENIRIVNSVKKIVRVEHPRFETLKDLEKNVFELVVVKIGGPFGGDRFCCLVVTRTPEGPKIYTRKKESLLGYPLSHGGNWFVLHEIAEFYIENCIYLGDAEKIIKVFIDNKEEFYPRMKAELVYKEYLALGKLYHCLGEKEKAIDNFIKAFFVRAKHHALFFQFKNIEKEMPDEYFPRFWNILLQKEQKIPRGARKYAYARLKQENQND